MPRDGDTHKRNVLLKDDENLQERGFKRYRVEWFGTGSVPPQESYIYSDRDLTLDILNEDWVEGARGLFGKEGSFRVYRPDGSMLNP